MSTQGGQRASQGGETAKPARVATSATGATRAGGEYTTTTKAERDAARQSALTDRVASARASIGRAQGAVDRAKTPAAREAATAKRDRAIASHDKAVAALRKHNEAATAPKKASAPKQRSTPPARPANTNAGGAVLPTINGVARTVRDRTIAYEDAQQTRHYAIRAQLRAQDALNAATQRQSPSRLGSQHAVAKARAALEQATSARNSADQLATSAHNALRDAEQALAALQGTRP